MAKGSFKALHLGVKGQVLPSICYSALQPYLRSDWQGKGLLRTFDIVSLEPNKTTNNHPCTNEMNTLVGSSWTKPLYV